MIVTGMIVGCGGGRYVSSCGGRVVGLNVEVVVVDGVVLVVDVDLVVEVVVVIRLVTGVGVVTLGGR